MFDDAAVPLASIAGPAILTNACAILQNGATVRYGLAVTQWRDVRASLAAGDGRLAQAYLDPDAAVALAERRVRLLLRGLGLLNGAVALFATTTVGLAGLVLLPSTISLGVAGLVMGCTGVSGLALLLAAVATAALESGCSRALLRLHGTAPAD